MGVNKHEATYLESTLFAENRWCRADTGRRKPRRILRRRRVDSRRPCRSHRSDSRWATFSSHLQQKTRTKIIRRKVLEILCFRVDGSAPHIARMDFPRDIRSGSNTWRLGRSPVGRARSCRIPRSCMGPTAVGPDRTRTVCSGRPCIRVGTGTQNRRRCLCTGCSGRTGLTHTCPPFL